MEKDGFKNTGCNWQYQQTTYAHYLQLALMTTLPPKKKIRENTSTVSPTKNYTLKLLALDDVARVSTPGVRRNDPGAGTETCLTLVLPCAVSVSFQPPQGSARAAPAYTPAPLCGLSPVMRRGGENLHGHAPGSP